MLLKCKKCGSQIEVPNGASFSECKNCGDRQVIGNPFGASDNAKIEALYQKAVASLNNARTEIECQTAKGQFEIIITYKDSQQKLEECEKKLVECTYNAAVNMLSKATAPIQFAEARAKFESIGNYKDSIQKVKECNEKYEYSRKDDLYGAAIDLLTNSSDIGELELAIMQLDSIIGHRDSRDKIKECREKIEKLRHPDGSQNTSKTDDESQGGSKIKIVIIALAALAVLGGAIAAVCAFL